MVNVECTILTVCIISFISNFTSTESLFKLVIVPRILLNKCSLKLLVIITGKPILSPKFLETGNWLKSIQILHLLIYKSRIHLEFASALNNYQINVHTHLHFPKVCLRVKKATVSSDGVPISNSFTHFIRFGSSWRWIIFKIIVLGKNSLKHGNIKQCLPESPYS